MPGRNARQECPAVAQPHQESLGRVWGVAYPKVGFRGVLSPCYLPVRPQGSLPLFPW